MLSIIDMDKIYSIADTFFRSKYGEDWEKKFSHIFEGDFADHPEVVDIVESYSNTEAANKFISFLERNILN